MDSELSSQKLEEICIKKKSPYLPGLRWNINIKHTSHSSIMIVQYMAMERQFCGLRPEFIDQKKSCQTQIGHKLLETNATGLKTLPECLLSILTAPKNLSHIFGLSSGDPPPPPRSE